MCQRNIDNPEDYDPLVDGENLVDVEPLEDDDEAFEDEPSSEFYK